MAAYYEEAMQTIIVKNHTDETLYNLKLTHNGEESNDYVIKKLKGKMNTRASLFTLKVKKNCDLILEYEYKHIKNSVVVYDKLLAGIRRYIVLDLTNEDGELKVNMSFQDIYD